MSVHVCLIHGQHVKKNQEILKYGFLAAGDRGVEAKGGWSVREIKIWQQKSAFLDANNLMQ